jgi:hypothetical protein
LRAAARKTAVERYDLRRICLPKQIAWLEGQNPQAPVTK